LTPPFFSGCIKLLSVTGGVCRLVQEDEMLFIRNLAVALLVMAGSVCFAASQGRDFSGKYLWRDPIELSDQVNVHVEMTIRNSNESVQGAQIVVKGQYDDHEVSTFLYSVNIGQGETVTFKGELLISKNEFSLWKNGLHPRFVISVPEGAGHRDQVLDLIPGTPGGATR
jgi:hypothetical protein